MVRKRVSIVLVGALVASMFAVASTTLAETAGSPSDQGVDPKLLEGNPNCATLNANDEDFPGITQDWGFKVEGSPEGTFPLDESAGGELTGDAEPDGTNSVTISNVEDDSFDWAATLGIDAVIVKASNNANVYVYAPEDEADGGLHGPAKDDGVLHGISHIEFCFDEDDEVPPEDPAHLDVVKFYDANANGINDDSHDITGWKVNVSPTPGDLFTPVSIDLAPGEYTVSEYDPVESNWVHTTPTSEVVLLDFGDEERVEFGNLCLGGGGGRTKGFWTNKNGQALIGEDDLAMLRDLDLVNADGSPFDPATKADVKDFLQGANAVNMANMLSAQLAAMALNVNNDLVDGAALIFAVGTESANALGFATVNDVMAEADAELEDDAKTPSGDEPNRTDQEAVKNALDAANNNQNFVQATPCAFSFETAA